MDTLSPSKILVRGANWVGDAVMSLPGLSALAAIYPAASITVLCSPLVEEIYRNHAKVSTVLLHERDGRHKGLLGKIKLARMLARHNFELAVLFQNAFSAALVVFLAGIPHRWGYARNGRSPLLTKAVKIRTKDRHAHEAFYQLNLLAGLGFEAPYLPPSLLVPDENTAQVETMFMHAGIGKDDFILLLAPGATTCSANRWPEKKLAEAAALILEKRPGRAVLLGGRQEAEMGDRLSAMLSVPFLNLIGKTSLTTVMAIMKRSNLLLVNDSGLLHLGSAMGIPLIALFGPSSPKLTSPLRLGRVLHSSAACAPCMMRICPREQICFDDLTAEKAAQAATSIGKWRQAFRHKKPAIFINPLGTIVDRSEPAPAPDERKLLPGAAKAAAHLTRNGYAVFLTSPEMQAHEMLLLKKRLVNGGADSESIHIGPLPDRESTREPAVFSMDFFSGGRAPQDLKAVLAHSVWIGDDPEQLANARNYDALSVLVLTEQKLLPIKGTKFSSAMSVQNFKLACEWVISLAQAYD